MGAKKQDPWLPQACDFWAKLCDMLESPEADRRQWVGEMRAKIAVAEPERKRPKLSFVAGGKSA